MTGVDVEHMKARLSDLRTQLDVCKVHRITPGPTSMESAISIAETLVATVERVQTLHTPWTNPTGHPYCKECLLAHPCPTIRALEMK